MDVRRVDQLRADKVCPTRRESPRSKDLANKISETASKKPSDKIYYKNMDVRRVDQLRADKVCPTRRESPRSKDFPRRDGLYAEVATRRTQNKVVKQLGQT